MVTIKDIAERLGIAVSTVSKGINGADDISEEMHQKILDTAIEMGYVSKRMRKEDHKKLAVFIENMEYEDSSSFGYDIVLGFRQMAMKEGWNIDVIPVTPVIQSKESYDRYMLRNGYLGGFLVGFALHDDWLMNIESVQTPTVLFDNYSKENPHVGYVGTDSYEGIDRCVTHLARLGHKRIAFLNGSHNSLVSDQRAEAFYQSMKSNGLPIDEDLIGYGYYVSESARDFVPGFLSKEVTAIVCGSDLLAKGAMEECMDRGFRIPEDISITGFDDLPIARTLLPPLTTIRQDRLTSGRCAYNTLSAIINRIPISKTMLRAILIERATTAECHDVR